MYRNSSKSITYFFAADCLVVLAVVFLAVARLVVVFLAAVFFVVFFVVFFAAVFLVALRVPRFFAGPFARFSASKV